MWTIVSTHPPPSSPPSPPLPPPPPPGHLLSQLADSTRRRVGGAHSSDRNKAESQHVDVTSAQINALQVAPACKLNVL